MIPLVILLFHTLNRKSCIHQIVGTLKGKTKVAQGYRSKALPLQKPIKQDQGSQVAPQVAKYHHTIPRYPLNKISFNVAVVETIKL